MNKSLLFTFTLSLGLCASLSAQVVGGAWERSQLFLGANIDDGLGSSLAVGPDMDGDGYPEVAVGMWGSNNFQGYNLGALLLASGKTGQILWSFEPTSGFGPEVGQRASFIPDLNGDGVADLISSTSGNWNGDGRVFILSGMDGSVVREHRGSASSGEALGWKVTGLPDVDGDGFGDYVYTSPYSDSLGGTYGVGRVDCRSGVSGQLLWQAYGVNYIDRFGRGLCVGADLNGDSIPEVFVSASSGNYVFALNGATGQILRTYLPSTPSSHIGFGWSLATMPDLDGDSLDELVVYTAFLLTNPEPYGGHVEVISSATGAVLWSHAGEVYNAGFGLNMNRIGDLNQDGYDELAVHELDTVSPLHILSGVDGSLLWTPTGLTTGPSFGYSVGSFDRDGDGIPELLVSEGDEVAGGPTNSGMVHVMSFKPYLYSRSRELYVSISTPLRLRLDFPDSEAGKPYAILASAAGNSTSVFHGLEIPLMVDFYFQFTVNNPPTGFRGHLNSSGDGFMTILVPPQLFAPLVGSNLYFAAVTGGSGQARLSSVAVPVAIVP